MSDNGFTPGPWTVDESDDVVTAYEDSDGAILVIAERCGDDAALIASAPTLYAALERATEELRYCRNALMRTGLMTEDERIAVSAEIANCEAALAKAREGGDD